MYLLELYPGHTILPARLWPSDDDDDDDEEGDDDDDDDDEDHQGVGEGDAEGRDGDQEEGGDPHHLDRHPLHRVRAEK